MAPRADAACTVGLARLAVSSRGVVLTGAFTLQTEASLESHQRMVADKLSVSELMTTQLVALEPVMRVRPAPDQLLLPWTLQCARLCPSLWSERDSPAHQLLSLSPWCAKAFARLPLPARGCCQ